MTSTTRRRGLNPPFFFTTMSGGVEYLWIELNRFIMSKSKSYDFIIGFGYDPFAFI